MSNGNSVDLKFVVDIQQLTTANTKLDTMETNLKGVQKTSTATSRPSSPESCTCYCPHV